MTNLLDPREWQPQFRVLLLSIPDDETLRALAALVPQGALIAMGTPDEVIAARRATADLDNVLFHTLDPEEIPWRDGYFHAAFDPKGTAPLTDRFQQELLRVLVRNNI